MMVGEKKCKLLWINNEILTDLVKIEIICNGSEDW